MNCRACGAADVPLTVIHKVDASGKLVPAVGVCASCTAPRSQVKMQARVFSAIRPGICAACHYDILIGERLAKLDSGMVVHAECAGN